MPKPHYNLAIYRDASTGRHRWAVMEQYTKVFYFPKRYGMHAAERLAQRMNKEAA